MRKEGEELDVFEVKSSLAGSSNTKDYIKGSFLHGICHRKLRLQSQ